MLSFLLTLLALAFTAYGATTNDQCLASCSNYSIILGNCIGSFGAEPATTNYTYANSFVTCLCTGQTSDGAMGNETANQDFGVCQSCNSTPPIIKTDLSQLLSLCTIQVDNGTAANATTFFPISYNTISNSADNGAAADAGQISSGTKRVSVGFGFGLVAVAAAVVLL